MRLIKEEINDIKIITEGNDENKNVFIEGIFLQGGVVNRNGRFYKPEILERAVNSYDKDFIQTGRAVGELSHGNTPQIVLERVSHKIVSLKREGNNWLGKAQIIDTPMGKIAKNLLEAGVKLGVSSKGLGSLREENGVKYVNDDFRLATAADIVADPSAPDAFVESIYEGAEWVYENGLWTQIKIDEARKSLNNCSGIDLESKILKIFETFTSKNFE